MKKTKERRLTNKLLAVLLSVVFIGSSISTAVFAVDGDDSSGFQLYTTSSTVQDDESSEPSSDESSEPSDDSSEPSSDESSEPSSEPTSASTTETPQQPTTPAPNNSVAVGTKFSSGNYMYQVTGANTVALKGFVKNVSLATVTVKSNVTYKGITYKVTKIGNAAFKGENGIKTVVTSLAVTNIGKHAFLKCKNLTKVRIKANVKVVGQAAFRYCPKLKTVNIASYVLNTVKPNAFNNIKSGAVINVMDASIRTLIKATLKSKVSINVM